jgi:hypothetical protein
LNRKQQAKTIDTTKMTMNMSMKMRITRMNKLLVADD